MVSHGAAPAGAGVLGPGHGGEAVVVVAVVACVLVGGRAAAAPRAAARGCSCRRMSCGSDGARHVAYGKGRREVGIVQSVKG